MSTSGSSRREFLITSLSGVAAGWAAANCSAILDAADFAQQAAPGAGSFAWFTAAQAGEVEAMAAQIIPTDSTPGAREAHVIRFIDRALTTFEKDRQNDYLQGLKQLEAQTKTSYPAATSFAALTSAQQIEVLTAIERTPFFNLVRTHTITGFLASPIHGGNVDKIGWKAVGYDDSLKHTPPFGYYDALPAARG
jgi:hypothetical protein